MSKYSSVPRWRRFAEDSATVRVLLSRISSATRRLSRTLAARDRVVAIHWGVRCWGLGSSVVVLEKSAKSLGTFDRTRTQRGLAFDQRVAETLVISLEMIVSHVLTDSPPERPFSKEDQSVEAFCLDRQNESLGEGVQVRRLGREFETSHAGVSESGSEFVCELGVSVVKQDAFAFEEALVSREFTSDLFHESTVGVGRDARDFHSSIGDLHEEE